MADSSTTASKTEVEALHEGLPFAFFDALEDETHNRVRQTQGGNIAGLLASQANDERAPFEIHADSTGFGNMIAITDSGG